MSNNTAKEEISQEDARWIEENVESSLPEAPMSIHVDSYLQGFHVGWTKRLNETNLAGQVLGIKAFVKLLIENGFNPSWNEETNVQAKNGGKVIPLTKNGCQHVNVKFAQSKTEANPGRWFKGCRDCQKFLGWQS